MVADAKPNAAHTFTWYNTRTGEWMESVTLKSDREGSLRLPPFPGGEDRATVDWAAKLVVAGEVAR